MFSLDRWLEIFETLSRNRLRTMLTALSVAWGIGMLVLLLGFGSGLENQVNWMFRDEATNAIWIYRGRTSLPYKGLPKGRRIGLVNRDHALISELEGVEHITSRFYLFGEFVISWKDKHTAFPVRSCHPDHQYLENTIITEGRFLNDLDLAQRRKVAVIGQEVANFLFEDVDPLGEYIDIGGILYKVVGVFYDSGGTNEMRQVYIPITTAQVAYGGGDTVHQIMFTLASTEGDDVDRLTDEVRTVLASQHDFDPADPRAVRVRNQLESFQEVQQIFVYLRLFLWLVGIGTILAGIVGVSNIMLVSVKERTREIGLRKALGATPGAIVSLILQESVLLTSIAGYVGLVVGVAILEVARVTLPENDYIRDPQVDLEVMAAAVALLVLSGALAGFFPARRAALVNPIVALRDE